MAAEGETSAQPLIKDFSADDEELEAMEIESLCVNCEENGITKLLLTKIPFFKSVIISSFECPHCHFTNNEIQPASSLQPQGCIYDVEIRTEKDLDRQVVKTDSASCRIPEVDFEIPAFTQKGALTTVEGLMQRAIEGLEQDQTVRRIMQPDVASQIDSFIEKFKNLPRPFHLIIDDPSGNSFVENPHAPKPDPGLKVTHYQRTKEHKKLLGYTTGEKDTTGSDGDAPGRDEGAGGDDDDDPLPPEEVFEFAVNCSNCDSPSYCRMKPLDIPFFKEVIIMATSCDVCNTKSNEIKSGGGIEDKGRRITLKMTDISDLSRDVLRSGTCNLEIPELDFLHRPMATTGGKFTTIEGLLIDVKNVLGKENPFTFGDSSGAGQNTGMRAFIHQLDKVIAGETLVTIILEDPSGNSYLQNVYAPEEDPEMTIEDFERSEDENDQLGLIHMKTENYYQEEDGAQNDLKQS